MTSLVKFVDAIDDVVEKDERIYPVSPVVVQLVVTRIIVRVVDRACLVLGYLQEFSTLFQFFFIIVHFSIIH